MEPVGKMEEDFSEVTNYITSTAYIYIFTM